MSPSSKSSFNLERSKKPTNILFASCPEYFPFNLNNSYVAISKLFYKLWRSKPAQKLLDTGKQRIVKNVDERIGSLHKQIEID